MKMFVAMWESLRCIERAVESIRWKLQSRVNFALDKAFRSLDHNYDGCISGQDVRLLV